MFVRPSALRRGLPAGIASAVLLSTALSGCGSDSTTGAAASPTASSSGTGAAAPLTITDPWVKAARTGMTAAFGTLVNTTGAPVNIVSATTPAAAKAELHEVVDQGGTSVMRPKEGGFVVPAKGSLQLQPGGNHIMLMGLTGPVEPGAQITVTLTCRDGRTLAFTAVAKEFNGGKENYRPGASASPSASMSEMKGMGGMSREFVNLRGRAAAGAGRN